MILEFIRSLFKKAPPTLPTKEAILKDKLDLLLKAINNQVLVEEIEDHCFFAGGCIRDLYTGQKSKDYDIFFKSEQKATEILEMLRQDFKLDYEFMFESKHTYSVRVGEDVFQFCKPPYCGSPDEVISKFDYTNCMAYFHFSTNKLTTTFDFEHAIHLKELVFNKKAYNPTVAVKRYSKFVDDGWQPSESFNYHDMLTLSAKSSRKSGGKGGKGGSFE